MHGGKSNQETSWFAPQGLLTTWRTGPRLSLQSWILGEWSPTCKKNIRKPGGYKSTAMWQRGSANPCFSIAGSGIAQCNSRIVTTWTTTVKWDQDWGPERPSNGKMLTRESNQGKGVGGEERDTKANFPFKITANQSSRVPQRNLMLIKKANKINAQSHCRLSNLNGQ